MPQAATIAVAPEVALAEVTTSDQAEDPDPVASVVPAEVRRAQAPRTEALRSRAARYI